MKFTIKDAPRCKSLDKLVKRLIAGEVPPSMPPPMPPAPKPLDLRFIDSLSHAQCEAVYNRVQARLSQMRIEDPMVYGIKRTSGGLIHYHTRIPGMGEYQCLAIDLNHSLLWLTSRRATAELSLECFKKNDTWDADWEVIEIPKVEAVKLHCYGGVYNQNPEMVGVA